MTALYIELTAGNCPSICDHVPGSKPSDLLKIKHARLPLRAVAIQDFEPHQSIIKPSKQETLGVAGGMSVYIRLYGGNYAFQA
jgi:hypothetical protein